MDGDSLIKPDTVDNRSTVRDLWRQDSRGWNKKYVKEMYGEYVGDKICELPIQCNGAQESIVWFHANNGCYFTKAGYTWLFLRRTSYSPYRFFWKQIWKPRLPPKVRIFAWRLGHDLLPTKLKIAAINKDANSACPRCNLTSETTIHAIRDYQKAKDILTCGGIDGRLLDRE